MRKIVKKTRVECTDLVVGMYVCELDRPWLDSPFLIQGFYIKDCHDIDTVEDICDYVFVDKVIDRDQLNNNLPTASSAILLSANISKPVESKPNVRMSRPAQEKQRNQPVKTGQGIKDFFPDKKLSKYIYTVSWRSEALNARRAVSYLSNYIGKLVESCVKGDRLNLKDTKQAVEPMVDSVIRNPDACLWSVAIKPAADYNSDSSLRSSVFSVVLGRRIGLPKSDLCLTSDWRLFIRHRQIAIGRQHFTG